MSDDPRERFHVTNRDPGWKDPAWTYHGSEEREVEAIFLWHSADRPKPAKKWPKGYEPIAKRWVDDPVCGLKTFRVTLMGPSVVVRCIAIANVYTPEKYRKRGYATSLLTRTAEYLITNGELVAILFSRERKLYQSVGFQKIGEIEGEWIYAKSLHPFVKLVESERWLIV